MNFIKRKTVSEDFQDSPWWKQAPEGFEDRGDGARWWYRISIFSFPRPWEKDPATAGGTPVEKEPDGPPEFIAILPKPTTKEYGGATRDYTRHLHEWERLKKDFISAGPNPAWDADSLRESAATTESWGMGEPKYIKTTSGWWAVFPDAHPGLRPYMERPEALTRDIGDRGDAFSPDNIVADYQEALFKRTGEIASVLHPFVPPSLLADMIGDNLDETPVREIMQAPPVEGENVADVIARVMEELRRQAEANKPE